MLVVAFLITGLAGIVVGIWLTNYAVRGQMSMNPAKMWAFIDTVKTKTIESYSASLVEKFDKMNPEVWMTPEDIKTFIKDTEESFKQQHFPKR